MTGKYFQVVWKSYIKHVLKYYKVEVTPDGIPNIKLLTDALFSEICRSLDIFLFKNNTNTTTNLLSVMNIYIVEIHILHCIGKNR
jgi:hypothetical protein